MPRISTTHDTFSAIAEPRRRLLLEVMVGKEVTVSEVVALTGWKQPDVSKHLGVLKQVGLVSERKAGRYRYYNVEASRLKTVSDWAHQFETYWNSSLDNLGVYLAEQKKE